MAERKNRKQSDLKSTFLPQSGIPIVGTKAKRSKKTPAQQMKITEEVITLKNLEELISTPTLLCLSGVQAGSLLPLEIFDKPFMVGRDEVNCDLFIDSPEISRQHAHIERGPDHKLYVVDRNSTNGVFVQNKRVRFHLLKSNDKIRFGPHSVWKFLYQDAEEHQYYKQLYSNASEDYLTGALNRRSFENYLEREISFSVRRNRNITVAICDIDFFKHVNDQYGHLVGDSVLKEFVKRLQAQIRTEDVLARYGGEEFVLMLRECSQDQSIRILERLRRCIADRPFATEAGPIDITVSIGTVTCGAKQLEEQTPHSLIQRADDLLYFAKETGRNRVCHTRA